MIHQQFKPFNYNGYGKKRSTDFHLLFGFTVPKRYLNQRVIVDIEQAGNGPQNSGVAVQENGGVVEAVVVVVSPVAQVAQPQDRRQHGEQRVTALLHGNKDDIICRHTNSAPIS